MNNDSTMNQNDILRRMPSVDAITRSPTAEKIAAEIGSKYLTTIARTISDAIRQEILSNVTNGANDDENYSRESLVTEAEQRLERYWKDERNSRLQRVINASGVIVHTNLGRAPLSEKAREAVASQAAGYCALEYDVETGKRGKRGAYAEKLLAELTGAESALIVNNCAAAAFLVLTVLASGGEVIISRGELVEIGGDFRVPDVMTQSGAILKEVGTTNRTRLADYEKAIGENTRLIAKVHPSNYRIVGFTATPELGELADLAHRNSVLLYEDAGSGALFDLSRYGLIDEPIISRSINAGADVVTFSGDKLLGGAQSGLIVGRRETIEKIRKHPLYRALRVDKLIYAALEATLEAFRRETALQEIPVLKMLSLTNEELAARTENFARKLRETVGENNNLDLNIIEGLSVVGGGAAPDVQPVTTLLVLTHTHISVSRLEQILRSSRPPVITRILDDKVAIDLRTVSENEEAELLKILAEVK